MRLSAPKQMTFWISLIIAIIGVVAEFVVTIPFLSTYTFIIMIIAFVLLGLGTFIKGF